MNRILIITVQYENYENILSTDTLNSAYYLPKLTAKNMVCFAFFQSKSHMVSPTSGVRILYTVKTSFFNIYKTGNQQNKLYT